MSVYTKFDNLALVEHGLILKNGTKMEREISFSELDKIYIKVDKLKPLYELGFILCLFLLIFLCAHYVTLDKVIFFGLCIAILVFVKINNYKSYGLIITLKEGTVFKKKVSLNLREENIFIIKSVRREQLHHNAKINASYNLESLEFCQNTTS